MLTEQNIETKLIEKLSELKYIYRSDIRDRLSLEQNFKKHFEDLNKVNLTDSEFARLRDEIVNADVYASAKLLRGRNTFEREDGTPLHYTLVNLSDWCKNNFEVINQLRMNTADSYHRYDVIILLNGIPITQIELKTLEISPRKAMQQIVDYKNDPGNGYTNSLLCFIQLFIVSNQTNTYYFSNNQGQHFSFDADERFLPIYQLATEDNKKVTHLDEFTRKFLPKCTLAQLISRYMVLVASEQKLIVMRPYQIYAVKAIVDCIQQNRGNGYIWHTTGSGKTLTSFKASTLLKDDPNIEKCLFVVDRKDLDRQTREEFNRFQEGCVEENTNTEALVHRLLSTHYADKVIVTTIQKLGLALNSNQRNTYKERLEALSNKRVVFIFDECHRSQFGENHRAIKDFFPKAQLFGFTGTPIFSENSGFVQVQGKQGSYVTTDDIFEKRLHAYTITHAIDDRNVLRFHVDYFKEGSDSVRSGDSVFQKAVVESILKKHDVATHNRRFNGIFATASINEAISYYRLFKEVQEEKVREDTDFIPLSVSCVFSPPAEGDRDIQQIQEDLPQEKEDNQQAPEEKKAALTEIIKEYNKQYGKNHKITEFDLYYQDIQKRIKDQKYPNKDYPRKQKIDIVIVVDMLLTGFDSQYLNTLYVDKNLRYHGLIQAFSRTNRVLNDTKPYGNILDFRNQKEAVDKAITLFSGEDAERSRKIWLADPASMVITKLENAVRRLDEFMSSQGLPFAPEQVNNLQGDRARGQFINLFKEVQRVKTQLNQYTDISNEQTEAIEKVIPGDMLRGFRGVYLDMAQSIKFGQRSDGREAVVHQLDFEFVLFASNIIDYDYIMELISRYTQKTSKHKMSREQLVALLSSSSSLMEERQEMIEYIGTLKVGEPLTEGEIRQGYALFKGDKFRNQVGNVAKLHGLESSVLQSFVNTIMDRMIFDADLLSDLMAPFELNWKERTQKELDLMTDLIPLLKKLAQGREISGLGVYE
ncbi:type I restriction endonuclease subunit R [Leptospira licerasiae]|uniref:Type I restriction enzyme endonuclease subunit n=1 Tax=Leptospira licerasiae str. MMD4847 TaxID=1049971 RepID=A0ABN0H6P9_9LEPT|nr:type I restriction endonuclease subunit R [Leptospira licerasiae]EIE00623.1 type I site-specific deoxyribonuclease, HsdR family / type I restriction/modification enzyme, subunit R, C-terminal multi-domain protein [Leptospira licerasiae serovar Varillal str. VAR 010]EJZ41261.1 type I site-specific deoxyribonuclease, HsdR family [Leptospira licerasiae str. MMD4847]